MKINIRVRGKSRNELLEIATIIQNFEKAKSSTIGGIRKINKTIKQITEQKTGVKFTEEQIGKIWSSMAVDSFKSKFGSGQVVNLLKKYGIDEALDIIEKSELSGIDSLFEIEENLKQRYNSTVDYNF